MAIIKSTALAAPGGPINPPPESPDRQAPTIQITAPLPNAEVSVTQITVKGTAIDAGLDPAGVRVVEYRNPDGTYTPATADAPDWANWSAKVPLPALPAGMGQMPYTVRIRGADFAGNAAPDSAVTVVIKDVTRPTVAIEPTPGYVITDTTFEVKGRASDAAPGMVQSGVKSVDVIINNVRTVAALVGSGEGVTWSAKVSVPTAVPASGAYTITAVCTDGAGLTAQHSVTVPARDATPPSLEIMSPLRGVDVVGDATGADVPFRGVISDTLDGTKLSGGLRKVECRVGASVFPATLQQVTGAGTFNWTASVKLPSLGTHTVTVYSEDVAGNSDTQTLTLAVAKRSNGEMSRSAYLADLLDYVRRTLKRDESGTPVDRQLLTGTFMQPFDVTPEPVHVLRIVIEVLRRYRTIQPAAHWKMDDASGNGVRDTAALGNHGTFPAGAGPVWVAGRVGGALSFDGIDDQVALKPDARLGDITNSFTLTFWANPTAAHEVDAESTGGASGTQGQRYVLGPEQGGIAYRSPQHSGAGVSVGTNGISVYEHTDFLLPALLVYSAPVTGWTHIAVVYQDRQPTLYVNGTLVKTGLRSAIGTVHARPASIGGFQYGFFQGQLDDVRIYGQPFSATMVGAVMRNDPELRPAVAAGEAEYRFAAYENLLKQVGTSFEEIRLARTADEATREAVAARLAVPYARVAPRPDTLDELFLEPETTTEDKLEQLFGLLSTQRNPLDLVKDSLLLTRRTAHVVAGWQKADNAEPMPLIDPDVIAAVDLRDPIDGARAYELWKARQLWAATELARLRTLRQSDPTAIGGMNKLIADIWDATRFPTPEPYPNLDAVEADRKAGKSIQKALDLLKLDLAAFLYLQRIRKLAASGGIVVKSEWEDVYAILLQVQKRRLYPVWKEAERQKNLTLSAEYFVLPGAAVEQALRLPAWRASAAARQAWQDVLRARIGQEESVAQSLREAVDAAEEATLPLLRDALVAAIGPDPKLPDRLTRRLLIDVRDSGFRMTTRVDQAIATLQEVLFSVRTGRSKEPDSVLGTHPAAPWGWLNKTEEQFDQEWRWMGSYETWRAATFVYHFPENLVLPSLREPSRMTGEFARFLQGIRGQNRLTPAGARKFAAAYLDDLFTGFGLAARWTFEEGKGVTVADASGHGNVAAFPPAGALPVWTTGRTGGGLSFDGSSYVRIEHAPSVDLGANNADFAVTFWLFLTKRSTELTGVFRSLLQKGNADAERALAIFLHPTSNRVHFRIDSVTSANQGGDSVREIPVSTWTHVAYVKSGNKLQLYLDGALDSEATIAGAAKANTGPIYLGKTPWTAGTSAVIDDLSIYNPSALGLSATPIPVELRNPAVLTDQLTDEGFTKRRALSEKLLSPYKDGTTSALKPSAPAYLEEVFYFVPMQIALQLQKSGQHLAALDWFQSVYAYNLPLSVRKIYAPLEYEKTVTSIYAASSDVWLGTGLNPHTIAAKRANAYTRFTLMSLVRCFVEFADAEFTRDTSESVPRARSLYMSALELLELPEMQPSLIGEGVTAVKLVNPTLTALRAHVELNLLKLRQGRNITGMQRRSEPEAERVVSAPTIGAGGQLVVTRPVTLRPTPYYYAVLIERAKQLVTIAQQMEAAYLAALEKRDAEAYSLLRARQDLSLTDATRELQGLRVAQAAQGVELAERQKARTQTQLNTYNDWLNAPPNALEEAVLDAYKDANQARNNLADAEYMITSAQAMIHAAASAAEFGAPIAFAGMAAATLGAFARAGLQRTINDAETTAQVNTLLASQERRAQEWTLQRDLADKDLSIGVQNRVIAESQQAIAEKEKGIADLQTDNARTVVEFLANKFTSAEMYEWMSGVLGGVYSYFLQQATGLAQLAADQLAFERQEPPPAFIQADYWQAPAEAGEAGGDGNAPDRRGLTGSARLLQDLYQLDQYAFQTNKRKLQLAQTFSLAALAPFEFQRFRETGRLQFETPMEQFDRAFPGHYLRLIRRVRTSVIALVPPSQGIRATLVSSGVSRVVIGGDAFQTVPVRRDPEVVALTSPTSATGMFELDTQSDMLLPFEGTGVATRWELLMPKAANAFDYRSIADVLFTIEYTALNSFVLRDQVIQSLPTAVSADRALSIRRQFPDQWYELHNPSQSAEPMTVRFNLSAKDFPPNLSAGSLTLQELVFAVARADGALDEIAVRRIKAPKGPVEIEVPTLSGTISTRRANGSAWKTALAASNPTSMIGNWELALRDDPATRALFATGAIEDLLMVFTYRGQGPAWI